MLNNAPGILPPTPEIFNTEPACAFKCGQAARVSRMVPKNFSANPSAQSSSVSSRKSPRLVAPVSYTHLVQVSRTIVSQVLSDGVAMLCNDLPATESFSDTASILERRIYSVLAVPLEVFDRTLGVIYLDASNPEARFDENHLQRCV